MDALVKGDRALILQTLNSPSLAIRGVQDENIDYYVQRLDELKDFKQVKHWKLNICFCSVITFSLNWTFCYLMFISKFHSLNNIFFCGGWRGLKAIY